MSDCIIWNGSFCSDGRYGIAARGSSEFMAHRQAYVENYGPIPKGMFVCHTCDNGLCVNPKHLFLGFHSDNMKDAARKKRLPLLLKSQKGQNNSHAIYTPDFIREIRSYYDAYKPSFSQLAKKFNLKSKGYAHAVVTRKVWADIK